MAYVSVTKLQSSFQGEISQTAARKIIEKMTRDGFVEPKGSKRLGIRLINSNNNPTVFCLLLFLVTYNFCIIGKRVIHSELTERKYVEVQQALGAAEAMVITNNCGSFGVYNYILPFIIEFVYVLHLLKFYRMLITVNQIASPKKLVTVWVVKAINILYPTTNSVAFFSVLMILSQLTTIICLLSW